MNHFLTFIRNFSLTFGVFTPEIYQKHFVFPDIIKDFFVFNVVVGMRVETLKSRSRTGTLDQAFSRHSKFLICSTIYEIL